MFVHRQVGFNRVIIVRKFATRLAVVENFNNMKLHLELLYLTFTTLFVLLNWTNCEPLSTVFVLETSDSDASSNSGDSVSLNNKAPVEDPNTQIITDDSPAQLRLPPSTKPPSSHLESQHQQPQHQQAHHPKATQHQSTDSPVVVQNHHSNPTQSSSPHHGQQSHQAVSSNHVSNGSTHQNHHETTDKGHSPVTTSRRLEEESHLVGATNQHKVATATRSTNHQAQTHQAASVARVKQSSTTTANPYDTDQNYGSNSTPKTEERLLISITSEDLDYKPPQKVSSGGLISGNGGGGSGGGSSEEYAVSGQQNPHHHQKRKPSITISIQDANNKQNEDSGPSAVIVRPSENGQSIVISTVGGTSILNPGNHHNNKFNNNADSKPAINIVTSPSHGHNNHNTNNDPPYKEPIEIPVHHQQHHTSTSTYRPSLVNEYNPVNPNRPPITSTLTNEERPQRPVVVSAGGSDDNYESSRPVTRPPSVPVRPTNQELTGQYDDNNSELSKPVNSNNQQQSSESKYPLNERNCGLVHETRIVGGEEANPDDFLWMAAIIKSKPKDGDARPFCGGSLITRRHILTAAHCLENLAPRDVLVRLGSYDFDDSTASSLSADFAIDQFRVPAQYSKKTHTADIAIMRLKTPLSLQDNYKTVCMPIPRRSYVGALGTVTGYGSQSQTFRRAAPKLRQVTVPIWENRKCSVVYKKNLTESFLCAGYEEGGKDACQGDSGGPLMTDGPNERMMIVGVVSHGIGCGSPGYPGVYTRTTTYLDWIEKNTKE